MERLSRRETGKREKELHLVPFGLLTAPCSIIYIIYPQGPSMRGQVCVQAARLIRSEGSGKHAYGTGAQWNELTGVQRTRLQKEQVTITLSIASLTAHCASPILFVQGMLR